MAYDDDYGFYESLAAEAAERAEHEAELALSDYLSDLEYDEARRPEARS